MGETLAEQSVSDPRWKADVYYRSDDGDLIVTHDIEEILDLHMLIERGPDWNTIIKIEITLARKIDAVLTVERSATS